MIEVLVIVITNVAYETVIQSDDESDDDAFNSSQGAGSRFVPVKDSLLFDDTGKCC